MPYSGPGDDTLPSNVQKLDEQKRKQWVSVFNSALASCEKAGRENCEGVAMKTANGVVKGTLGGIGRRVLSAAEPPKTINIFPIPGEYDHPMRTIFVDRESNEELIRNFEAHVYQEKLPIDAEHETKLSGAIGWITDLSLNEDESIEAVVEWTERGEALIRADGYKYVSPEWFLEWEDPATGKEFHHVLIGAALTTQPFFKEGALRPLVASESGTEMWVPIRKEADGEDNGDRKAAVHKKEKGGRKMSEGNEGGDGEGTIDVSKLDLDKLDEEQGKGLLGRLAEKLHATLSFGGNGDGDGGGDNGDGDGDGDGEGEGNEKKPGPEAVTASELISVKAALKVSEEAREADGKRLGALEATNRTARLRDIVLGRDEAGTIKAKEAGVKLYPMIGDLEGKVRIMEALGEDSGEFVAFVSSEREHARAVQASGTFSETGMDTRGEPAEDSPIKAFDAAVNEAMSGDNAIKDRTEAEASIAASRPELYKAYDQEVKSDKDHTRS